VLLRLIALIAALLVATGVALLTRRRSGRFRHAPQSDDAERPGALTPDDLGAPLGERATLVQFSTAFCAPCRPTRQVLRKVAGMIDGVEHVEIDATDRMDLVRRLRIQATPTVFVLGPDGSILRRATGQPRVPDVIAAVGEADGLITSEINR
jgi:thiol-disulfide isomerase/thioredoxin